MGIELGVGIKVDPQDSVSKAKAVEDGLGKVEDRGIAAGKAMLGLAGAFKSLGQAMQQHQQALERTHGIHDRLVRQGQPLAQGFNKIAEAIQREQQMLERIHGPAQRYAQDLQTLDALLARNVISTQQYADQVKNLNGAIDGRPKVANSNVPTAPSSSAMGGLRAGAAAVGVTVGIGQIGALANEYQNLENRLRYLAGGDMAKVNSLFSELQGVASRTRADLSATTEAFVRVSLATKQMGLSSSETMLFTERLNKAITLSGATGAEAAAGMIQLSQGLASGALRGDELRSVLEQLPAVADVIAQGLGVTRGQLRSMGADGKITADVIVNAFKKAGDSLDKDFGNTVPTISQSFTMFKNEMVVTIGELDKALGVSKVFGDVLGAVGQAIKLLLIPLKLAGELLSAIGVSGTAAAAGIAGMVMGGPLGAIVGVTAALAAEAGAFDDVTGSILEVQAKMAKLEELQNKVNTAVALGTSHLGNSVGELVQYNLQLTFGAQAAEAFAKALQQAPASALDLEPVDVGQFDKNLDAFNKLGEANEKWFVSLDASHKRSVEMQRDRTNEVTLAREELKALELAKGGVANYAEEKKRLLAIINGTTKAQGHAKKAEDDYGRILKEILGPQQQAARDLSVLNNLYMNGRISLEQLNEASAKRRDLLLELGLLEVKSVTNGNMPATADYTKGLDPQAALRTSAMGVDWAAYQEALEEMRLSTIDVQDDMAQKAREAAQATQEAWAQGLGSIGGSFIQAALDGKQSFSEMAQSMLKDIAMLIVKMAALRAIQGGGAGAAAGNFINGLLGGANGFDYVANNNRVQLPGFATGGSFTVGGAGGTDSKIAMFRVTPGESVHVRTPQQQMAESNWARPAPAGPMIVNVIQPPSDPWEVTAAMGTNDGDRVLARHRRKYDRRRVA